MIELEHVSKHYGTKVAVADLSLRIDRGEFFAVLGPNGAGKTTTIKMICGLLRPTSGTVRVCGFDLQKQPLEAKRLMAYVPDQPFLYDKLSGLEFMHFIANMYGVEPAARDHEIARMCEMFDMKEWVRELTEAYSHGMKQRVVLAATLLHHPKVIVVDEPMVGLDPHTARLVRGIFMEEVRKGTSLFMSTHVISVAEDCAQRIGIIMNGRVVALGRPDELRRQAQTDGKLEDAFFRITEGVNGNRADSGTPADRTAS